MYQLNVKNTPYSKSSLIVRVITKTGYEFLYIGSIQKKLDGYLVRDALI